MDDKEDFLKNESTDSYGAFTKQGEQLVLCVTLDFNASHHKYGEYITRLKKFVKECEEDSVLFSSSGI